MAQMPGWYSLRRCKADMVVVFAEGDCSYRCHAQGQNIAYSHAASCCLEPVPERMGGWHCTACPQSVGKGLLQSEG